MVTLLDSHLSLLVFKTAVKLWHTVLEYEIEPSGFVLRPNVAYLSQFALNFDVVFDFYLEI